MTREEIIDGLELYTVGRLKKSQVYITVEELQKYIDEIKALEQESIEVEATKLQMAYDQGFEDCRKAVMDCFKKWQPYMATRSWDFEQELSALPPVKPQEANREIEDYENEIEDLHNRLDIAEYDKERLREEVTNLETKIKALEIEPCEDAISRQVIDEIKELMTDINGDTVYAVRMSDIRQLPSVNPQEPKTGKWVQKYQYGNEYCSKCDYEMPLIPLTKYCPNCGAKMVEPQESEDKE